MEKWKKVVGYEGYYSISNRGQVRRDKPECNTFPGRIMKQSKNERYARVTLTKNGFQKLFSVHRLVAIAYLGKPPKGKQVNHKDTNKRNNYLSNLEYLTPKENSLHSLKNGCQPIGSKVYNAKLTEEQVINIRKLYSQGNFSQQKLANLFNVSQVLISIIILRKRWKHV